MEAIVITISDKGAIGEREDTAGPALIEKLTELGYQASYYGIVPDEQPLIEKALRECAIEKQIPLILTCGGTGFSKRDVTPEATEAVIEKNVPGLPELMRSKSMEVTPNGCLSRGVSGILNNSLIVNLPGSRKAALENLSFIEKPLEHGLKMLLSEGSNECARNNE